MSTPPSRATASPSRAPRVPEDARRAPAPRAAADAALFAESPASAPAPAAPPAAPPAEKTPPAPATTLDAAFPRLVKPFAPRLVELKPGAVTKDRARALAMPFVDMRAYQDRLDRVVGPAGWNFRYLVAERGIACELTILGVTKSAVGDYPIAAGDENPATSAEAQAFKRACAAFGLGRYLYRLSQVWGDYDDAKRQFRDPGGIVRRMYDALATEEE
jgi:hypothetical protein